MATLKEDFEILKAKSTKLEAEKEDFELQKNSLTFKLQGYIDQNEEKDEIIKHMEIKLETKTKELEEFKKATTKLNAKLKNYEEAEVGPKGALKEEAKEKKRSDKSSVKLQKEILVLQHKLKLKDEILDKLRSTDNLTEDAKNLFDVNQRQLEEIEEKERKSKESRIKQALLNNQDLSDIDVSNDSFYMSESDVEQLVSNQKMIHERIEDELAQKRKMREEIEDLKTKLTLALEDVNPDIQEITTALVEDRVQEMKKSFDRERERLLSDLSNRVQKVCDLEMELDMLRDEYRRLEKSLSTDDHSLKLQITQYQRQLEQTNLMYHNALSDNHVLKVDVQLFEKKLKTREARIATLEKSFRTLTEQNNTMKTYLKRLKTQMMEVSVNTLDSHNMSGIPSNGRIVKKIKAGSSTKGQEGAATGGYKNRIVQKVIGDPFGNNSDSN